MANEFDIESFAAEERTMLDNLATEGTNNSVIIDPLLVDSSGPVTAAMEVEMQKEAVRHEYRWFYSPTFCYMKYPINICFFLGI